MSRHSIPLSLALCASMLIAPTLAAQDQWEQQVRQQLIQISGFLTNDGYTLTHVSTDNALNDDGTFELWLDLEGGVEYAIVGVCDEDCSDVDLEVFSSEGVSIDSYYDLDDFPLVALIPNRSARFRIHVYMAACSLEPCSWGVGIFGR